MEATVGCVSSPFFLGNRTPIWSLHWEACALGRPAQPQEAVINLSQRRELHLPPVWKGLLNVIPAGCEELRRVPLTLKEVHEGVCMCRVPFVDPKEGRGLFPTQRQRHGQGARDRGWGGVLITPGGRNVPNLGSPKTCLLLRPSPLRLDLTSGTGFVVLTPPLLPPCPPPVILRHGEPGTVEIDEGQRKPPDRVPKVPCQEMSEHLALDTLKRTNTVAVFARLWGRESVRKALAWTTQLLGGEH